MKLLSHLLILALSASAVPAAAQQSGQTEQRANASAPLARHLVMFTREGPNFAKIREHLTEAREHQALYERLAAEGHTIAGGAFEGTPILSTKVWTRLALAN